ncbi:WD40-repeat-containing domain [Pseudocohnilembus persalinus]|uniref:WD40-repeat-containing domain n=1 Tax=Pseudocohnilembus persalinus TaxID=266149 RepID=A0A0V0QGT5_PSEPJ|nr:WD40-repeat-containing domain [Pseudocohnilembus persalinus]|eukprot:KRX01399.1 WD40-repeat-containing domain [Pseudocohnilembus persalinus]
MLNHFIQVIQQVLQIVPNRGPPQSGLGGLFFVVITPPVRTRGPTRPDQGAHPSRLGGPRGPLNLQKKDKIMFVTSEQNILMFNVQPGPKLSIDDVIVGYNDEITDAKFKKQRKAVNNPFVYEKEFVIAASNSDLIKAINLKTKETQLLKGHSKIVMSVDVFEDYIISAGKDKTCILWKFRGTKDEFNNNIQYDPENENDKEKIAELYEKRKQNCQNYYSPDFVQVAIFHGHIEVVTAVSIAPKTGKLFASCSSDKNIKIWSLNQFQNDSQTFDKNGNYQIQQVNQSLHNTFGHEKDINVVRLAPNEKLLASASQDRSIKIWKVEGLTTHLVLKGHKRGVWDVAFSPVEQVLASASGDQTVKIWNLLDGQCIHTLEGHIGSVLKVQWICHGLEVLSAGGDALVKIWNIKKETCVNTFEQHEGKIWALDASNYDAEGKQYFLSGGNDSEFFVYEDTTQEEEQKKKLEEHEVIIQQQNYFSFIREKDYIAAAKLAFKQNFTQNFYKSLNLLFSGLDFQNEIIFQDTEMKVKINEEHFKEQEQKIEEMVQYFVDEDMNRLLVFIRDMNVSQKHSKVAQKLLNYLLKIVPLEDFIKQKKKFKILNKKKQIESSDYEKLLTALEVYSQKHLDRTQKFLQNSYYLDFVIQKIDALAIQSHNIQQNFNNDVNKHNDIEVEE